MSDEITNVTRRIHSDRDDGCVVTDGDGRCGEEIVVVGSVNVGDHVVYYHGYCEDHAGFGDE